MTATAGPGKRPAALVTGASSGIGLELARVLAGAGHRRACRRPEAAQEVR